LVCDFFATRLNGSASGQNRRRDVARRPFWN